MKKFYLAFLILFCITVRAQTITVEAQMTGGGIYSGFGSDCGDCFSSVDPRVYARFKNSSSGTWGGSQGRENDNVGCDNYGGRTTGSDYVVSGIPRTDQIQIQMNGFEDDNGCPIGATNDGNCGGFNTPSSGDNNILIQSATICNYSARQTQRDNCSSDGSTNDYRVFWRFRWFYDASSLTSANAGGGNITISTASDANICDGGNPSQLNAAAGITGCSGYQWEQSVNGGTYINISGATLQNYDPPALSIVSGATTTYTFRRRSIYVTNNSCGTTNIYTGNTFTITVKPDPTIPSATKSPNLASVCVGTLLSLNTPTYGTESGQSCGFEYRYSTDNGTTWTAYSATVPSFAAVLGTNLAEIRVIGGCAAGNGCNASPAAQYSWTVEADPTSPNTSTKSPTAATVCAGSTLTLSGAAFGGNTGLGCSIEYQYSTNGGTTFTSTGTTIPSFTAPIGTSIIQARRNSCQAGCEGPTPYTTVASWTVVADPATPSATKSPNVATVCSGQMLTAIGATDNGGGTGTCALEYRYNDGTGFTAWSLSTPNFPAGVGSDTIQIRKTCDGSDCGSSAPLNLVWTVVNDPSAPTATKAPNDVSVCAGSPLTISGITDNGGGTGTCNIEYSYDNGSGYTAYSTMVPSFTAVTGTNSIRMRKVCNGGGCDTSGVTTYSWTVVADPQMPNATKVPNYDSTCVNTPISLTSIVDNGGGTGTCNMEYRYNTGTGFSSWSTTIPSFNAVLGTNTIEMRKNCSGSGCDLSSVRTFTWTVLSVPQVPSASRIPSTGSVCYGTYIGLTNPSDNGGGNGTCRFEYRYDTGTGFTSWDTILPYFVSALGVNTIEMRKNCSSGPSGCGTSSVMTFIFYGLEHPTSPTTATKSPAGTNACAGSTLTITSGASGGQPGFLCNIEYRHSTNGGSSYVFDSITIPSFAAVAGALNIIQARRNDCLAGCNDPTTWNTIASWTIDTPPQGGTISPTEQNICAGFPLTSSLVLSGRYGSVSSWQKSSDASFSAPTTISATGDTLTPATIGNLTGTTYYRAVISNGVCGDTFSAVSLGKGPELNPVYTLDSDTGIGNSLICDDGAGWTYYQDPDNVAPNQKYLFAIKWGANASAKSNATVSIGLLPTYFADTHATYLKGTWVMKRYWNVDLNGSTLSTPVDVRFYYIPSEKSAIETAAGNFSTSNSVPYENFVWFKTQSGAYDPVTMTDYMGTARGNNIQLTGTNGVQSGINYVQFNGLTSFSGGSGAAGAGTGIGNPLPVELIEFSALAYDKTTIKLDWTTASEKNNSHFIIERSIDGSTFVEAGKVLGSGTSATSHKYNFFDKNLSPAIYYYRLKQVDLNGDYAYSSIRKAELLGDEEIIVSDLLPNPANNKTEFIIESGLNTTVQINISNTLGQVIKTIKPNLMKGSNTVPINVEQISSGTYNVLISFNGKQIAKKMVVHH